MNMNKKEIRDWKGQGHKKFNDILPYTAKNGIRFSFTGVSLVTQHGIVFTDNGYLGGANYYPLLQHIESAGDGSIAYNCSIRVEGFGVSNLERLANAIESNIKKNIAKQLKAFS